MNGEKAVIIIKITWSNNTELHHLNNKMIKE